MLPLRTPPLPPRQASPESPPANHFPTPVPLLTAPRLPSRTSRLRPPSRARPQITITITTTTYPFQSTCPRLRPRPTRRRPLRPLLRPSLLRLLRLRPGLERGWVAGRPALTMGVRGDVGGTRMCQWRTQGPWALFCCRYLYAVSAIVAYAAHPLPLPLSSLSSAQHCVTRNRVRVCNSGSTDNTLY